MRQRQSSTIGGMDSEAAYRLVGEARVGHLATVTGDGRPHVVPCCFALSGETIYTSVDAKPKSTRVLRRLDNIRRNGRASLLVDYYEEEWSELWWVRADGRARILESASAEETDAMALLRSKYPQYSRVALTGPVIALEIETWRSWP